MLIENDIEVEAPVDQVWKYMLDVPRMAPCIPGAEITEELGDNKFKGRVTTKMGPVSLRFAGDAEIVEQDESGKKIVMKASGSEEKGKGQANMTMTSTLQSAGNGTRIKVSQDLELSGAAAQYGRGMIEDVTGTLMKSFASCVQEDVGRAARGEERAGGAAAAPMRGFSIARQAAMTALKRFFRRFFGRGPR
ncbi:MAG: SRPBCC family protein [Actinomycetota bacterium]|nr:SRPBCC family protein [Actinomycetota bacterium]